MILYHFTDREIKDKIKVKYFADSLYTDRDKRISNIKRAFFFTDRQAPEHRFCTCKYRYIVNIKDKYIYNLKIDKKQYIKRYKDIDNILRAIKRQYKGAIYNLGSYDVVILFYDIAILKKGLSQ